MGCFQGTGERVRNSRGRRAISVRATEVLLYNEQGPHSLPRSRLYCIAQPETRKKRKIFLWSFDNTFLILFASEWTNFCTPTYICTNSKD